MYIYKLEFTNKQIYVGKTTRSLKSRLQQHISAMRRGTHHSYKVQEAYSNYGEPIIIELEETSLEHIDTRECFWINTLDSFYNGLNCALGGAGSGVGAGNSNAKYLDEDYYVVLWFLASTDWPVSEIANELDISVSTVTNISVGRNHQYLAIKYPDLWKLNIDKKGSRASGKIGSKVGKTYPAVISPNGEEFSGIINVSKFCREHNLHNSNFNSLLNRKSLSCTGWTLA